MIENLPKTRKEAILIGSKYYYSGPCGRGHTAPRLTRKAECTECKKENDRRYAKDNSAKAVARAVKWNKDNSERRKEIANSYYDRNKDKYAEVRQERFANWYYGNHEENKKSKRIKQQNREAQKRENGGSFTRQDIEEIMLMQKGKCAVCGIRLDDAWHIDHIIAVSKGGCNNRSNLQILCMPCNVSKKDQDPIDFMQKLGRLL